MGKQKHYFQEIFDSFDYTYHPSTFDQVDDMRLFKIEEKMSIARENNDIEKITEYRYNIKQLALKGQLSKQTKEYIKRKILLFRNKLILMNTIHNTRNCNYRRFCIKN